MIRVEKFRPEHAAMIEYQDAQVMADAATVRDCAEVGNAFTCWLDDRIILMGGVVDSHLGPHLWAAVAKDAPMHVVHRLVKRFLSLYRLPLNATVATGFNEGCRWLEMLGFSRVGVLRAYDGICDHIHYRRDAVWLG